MVFAPCVEMRDRLFQQEMGGFHVARRGRREKAQGVWVVGGGGGGGKIAHTALYYVTVIIPSKAVVVVVCWGI